MVLLSFSQEARRYYLPKLYINKKLGRDNIMVKAISTEKDLLLKADKVFPWEEFRNKLESLYLT
ncbi:hypothetical protein HFC64_10015 [Saccharolobus solfataricus]|uniref:Uncharacterized protein n=1 Tax=Saccharolobus solfataricus TaxID=2287 RepID=A0A7S9IG96_SACSO|nr:hypothetical protein [Saccharolobus solfataricus]QPG48585.1 hypothetical protein HFC64_10015 [Saccharolobus solfataricus]